MRVFAAALTVSLVVPLSTLSAQQSLPLEPGARVRVTAPDCGIRSHATTVEALRGDTLELPEEPTESSNPVVPIRCPIAAVSLVEVQRGRRSRSGRGAFIGCVIGVGSGAVAGFAFGGLCSSNSTNGAAGCRVGVTAVGAGAFGLLGAGIGALIGALSKTDRWEEVPLDRLRVSFTPQRDGFALGLRVAL